MRQILLSLFFTIIAFSSVFSQVLPKLPDGWEQYVAEDKSFAVLLPKINPKTQAEIKQAETLADNLFGRNPSFKQSYLEKVSFAAGFQDFSAPLLDDLEKEAQYELLEETMGEKTGDVSAYNFSEMDFGKKTIVIGAKDPAKFDGIQTVKEVADYYIFSRLFIAEQRLFRLLAVVKKDAAESQRENILRFFSSFRIGKIPPAKNPATPLPPNDYKITLIGQQFQSERLKLDFQFPQNWKIEVFDAEKQKLTPEEQKEYEKNRAGLRLLWRNRQGFVWANSPQTKSNMALIVNRQPFFGATLPEFVADRAKLYSVPVSNSEINGQNFLLLSREDKENHYFIKWNEYFLEVFIKYENDADLKLMEESLKTLTVLR